MITTMMKMSVPYCNENMFILFMIIYFILLSVNMGKLYSFQFSGIIVNY
jgi:hypothetical protein